MENYERELLLYQQETADESNNPKYFDNLNHCQDYFGRQKIKTSIYFLIFISFISIILFLHYSKYLKKPSFYIQIISISGDLLAIIFYLIILYKLKESYPLLIIQINNYLITFTFIVKLVVFILIIVQYFGVKPLLFYLGKFILDSYFFLDTLQVLLFSSCGRYITKESKGCCDNLLSFFCEDYDKDTERRYTEYENEEDNITKNLVSKGKNKSWVN